MSIGGITIDAAVATAPDAPFVIEQLALRAPAANEILVRLVATSVCHTDVFTKSHGFCAFPAVLGHEGAGIVEQLGSDVQGFDVGDHVVLSFDACGDCAQCDVDKPGYCNQHADLNFSGMRRNGEATHQREDGQSVSASFFQQSSFATYALSHPSNTVKVDSALPLALLAPLGCGVQTGAGAVLNTLSVEAGSRVGVFGCGCVGLSAILAAQVAGARDIIAVDVQPRRLELATELGATAVFDASANSPESILAEIHQRIGPLNYAIDTTGIPAVLKQAFDACGPMGTTAMIAPGAPGSEVTVDMLGLLPGKQLRGVIQGDAVPQSFIPQLIQLWQDGQFPFDRLISTYDGIESLDAAVNDMNRGDVVKPVVIFDPAYGVQS